MTFTRLLQHPGVRCAFALWLGAASSQTGAATGLSSSLPNLPSSNAPAPGYFNIAEDSAGIGYASRLERWGAKVEQYKDVNPAVKMDYGRQLSDKLSAGGTFTRQNDYSEVVVNGIYAPQPNLRFRMTGAQLRATGGYFAPDATAFMQNSYLFGAKKFWNKYEYLSDLGVAAYSVEASAPPSANLFASGDEDAPDASTRQSGASAPGRLDGYTLNLGLRPTARSKLEFSRESTNLTHNFDAGFKRQELIASNRVRYSHYFGNCMRLQGGYSAGEDFGRVDLKLTKKNWNVRLWHAQESGSDNTAIQVGYTLPLGRTTRRASDDCGVRPGTAAFEPIVDAARQRPSQIPRAPLPTATMP